MQYLVWLPFRSSLRYDGAMNLSQVPASWRVVDVALTDKGRVEFTLTNHRADVRKMIFNKHGMVWLVEPSDPTPPMAEIRILRRIVASYIIGVLTYHMENQ